MKAITAVCSTGASVPGIASGRVSRHRDGENAEIQMYLSKLKDLVPFMPKNRKLSKLEVIQHVIDYICDLQSALETHPAVNNFDAAAALNQPTTKHSTPVNPRQPLGVRPSPNTILTTTSGTSNTSNESHNSHPVNSSSSAAITTPSEKPVSSDRMDLC